MPQEIRDLIRSLSLANPLWGVPRIHGELLKLGIEACQATVGQVHGSAAQTALPNVADFPEQPCPGFGLDGLLRGTTGTFRVLYIFVMLAHERRRLLHFNVTSHPSSEWAAQQVVEALPLA